MFRIWATFFCNYPNPMTDINQNLAELKCRILKTLPSQLINSTTSIMITTRELYSWMDMYTLYIPTIFFQIFQDRQKIFWQLRMFILINPSKLKCTQIYEIFFLICYSDTWQAWIPHHIYSTTIYFARKNKLVNRVKKYLNYLLFIGEKQERRIIPD